MDKLKKTIELIGSHQNVLSHYVVDPGVNLTTQEMFDVLIKEIEQYKHTLTHDTKEIKLLTAEIDQKDEEIKRLKKEKDDLVLANKGRKALSEAQFSCMEKLEKEKEWLVWENAKQLPGFAPWRNNEEREELKKTVIDKMQQALKEE